MGTWSAEVDLLNQSEVVRYIRDLINLAEVMQGNLDDTLFDFTSKLKNAGYSAKAIQQLLIYASTNTRYDHVTDDFGNQIVPRAIPDGSKY